MKTVFLVTTAVVTREFIILDCYMRAHLLVLQKLVQLLLIILALTCVVKPQTVSCGLLRLVLGLDTVLQTGSVRRS